MANYSGWGHDLSFYADQDFSSCGIYRFVAAASTAGYVQLATTANASVLGVIQNNPKQNEQATVRILGTTKLELGSASAASYGEFLKTASTGQGIGYKSLTASVWGVAVALEEDSSGSGVIINALLLNPGVHG